MISHTCVNSVQCQELIKLLRDLHKLQADTIDQLQKEVRILHRKKEIIENK